MTLSKPLLILKFACLLCLVHARSSPATDEAQPTAAPQILFGHLHKLTFLGQEKIPPFHIDDMPARVHTQGIYVSNHSIYVTGRLERIPKRAMFFRFNRHDLAEVEVVDITPQPDAKQNIAAGLDHPGGFDYDGTAFWIPVAVSKPRSSTAVLKINTPLDAPLAGAKTQIAFVLRDHIGALACDTKNQRLLGANWDTRVISVWRTDGTEWTRMNRDQLIRDDPHWALAVQDWKYLSGTTLLAGGLDKNPRRDPAQSRAVLDWIDIERRQLLDRIHIVDPTGGGQNLTHEGMALFQNDLFLLPRDLGDHATLYRYRVEQHSDE